MNLANRSTMMRKTTGIMLLLAGLLCSVVMAEPDWMTARGTVTDKREGRAVFFTFTATDGTEHQLNCASPAGQQYGAVFASAFQDQAVLEVEFRSHEKYPNSIWWIRNAKRLDKLVAPEPDSPVAVASSSSVGFGVAGIFRDGMVLQRDMPVPVWGWAKSGAEVTVEFAGQKKTAVASDSGTWQVFLDPMPASFEPRKMIVISQVSGFKFQVSDVLVGEVWILGGQSNMDWWLQSSDGGPEAAAQADYPWLRLFDPGWKMPDAPAEDVARSASWTVCTPEKAGSFSAIGFWMAEKLHKELDVPVGLLKTSVSGTYGESWVPKEVLESIPSARPRLEEYAAALQKLPEETARWQREKADHEQAVAEARRSGKAEPAPSFFVRKGPMGPNHFHRPYALYNGRIAPLMPYALRGVVWYQGEGNSQKHRAGYYKDLLKGLVGSWREGWQQERLPFLIVQLPKFKPGPHNDWPLIREAQREAVLALEDTGLVVTIDTGDPEQIHPTDKKTVAERVARLAQAMVYGESMVPTGPLPAAPVVEESFVTVAFESVGEGLKTLDNGTVKGFETAGADGVFHEASAEIICADRVRISCPAGQKPVQIRYAWADCPVANLVNSAALPASPFAMDLKNSN
jgi:sialate O-acetylesterase